MSAEDFKPKFTLHPGDPAPNFFAPNQAGKLIELYSISSEWTILFFYPQDLTPTCIKEACNLRDNYTALKKLKCKIFGISQDDETSHKKFIDRYTLPYELLVDSGNKIATDYNVYSRKKFMGIAYTGIHRSTFILDEQKKIHKIIYPVVSANHHSQIIEAISK